jgi:predicted small integral membrane protein
MAWTPPTALFFTAVALMLAVMTVWELRAPSVARRGFLPIPTTRGDRLFIGLLVAAFVNLGWVALMHGTSQWYAVGLAAAAMVAIGRWG